MEVLINEHRDNLIETFRQTQKQQDPANAFAPGTDSDTDAPPVPRSPVPQARPALHLVSVATAATGPP